VFKPPTACTRAELRAFESLVQESGEVTGQGLPDRIRRAACLAFHYSLPGELVAIAALKVPHRSYRDRVFTSARSGRRPEAFPLELGWFFVRPSARGRRTSGQLAASLLRHADGRGVFATTRASNSAMLKVLQSLGFRRSGAPYRRRSADGEDLVLLVRPKRREGVRA
jgi:GNAT superfamily N-acetyltransferase